MNETNENRQVCAPDEQEMKAMLERASAEMKAWCDEGDAGGRKRAVIIMLADLDLTYDEETGLDLNSDDSMSQSLVHGNKAVANIAAAALLDSGDMIAAKMIVRDNFLKVENTKA